MKPPRVPFEELVIPRRELPKLGGRYRVYKDVGNYITVEAASALEAFKQSGMPQAHRIQRDAIYLTNVLNLEALSQTPAPSVAPPAETAAAAPDPAEAAPAAAPAAPEGKSTVPPATETPLSSGDVDKLLKGEAAAPSAS